MSKVDRRPSDGVPPEAVPLDEPPPRRSEEALEIGVDERSGHERESEPDRVEREEVADSEEVERE